MGTALLSTPAISSNGTLYVGGPLSTVFAIDPATGADIFQYTIPGLAENVIASSIAIGSDGALFIGGNDGSLVRVTTPALVFH